MTKSVSRKLITTGYHLPYNSRLKESARELRRNMTDGEKKMWYSFLRNFRYRVLRQKPIDNYIVDFHCPKLRLVIEIDGETHFTEEGKVFDEKRTNILKSYGIKIIRFTNPDVLSNFEGVCQKIDEIPLPPLLKGD